MTRMGYFHCWGREAVSRLQFAHHVADVFEADRNLVVPLPSDPIALDRFRNIRVPFRIITSNEKTCKALGRRTYDVLDGLRDHKQQWDDFGALHI